VPEEDVEKLQVLAGQILTESPGEEKEKEGHYEKEV
jgi:hypothetical protein